MATLVQQGLSSTWNGIRLVNLNQQVGDLLNEIGKIANVQTACIFDNHGKVLGALTNASFDKGEYNRVGAAIAQCYAAIQSRAGFRDLEFRFERRFVYTRDLGNAFFAAFCSLDASLSMLRMTLNVSAAAFEADPELQINLRRVAESKKDTLATSYLDVLGSQLVEKASLK